MAARRFRAPPRDGEESLANKLNLTLATGDYESIRALKEGSVAPDGVALNVLTDMDSSTRHWRMLRNRDFDICELSLSSYLVARDQDYPLEAIPVFLHRRFRHGFVFVNTASGISEPGDLIGKRIGVKTFQTTAILWLRGMLEHEYGVPHTGVTWVSELIEDVAFTPGPDLTLERAPAGRRVEDMLAEGEIDACLHADLIDPIVAGDPRVGRLFENYADIERDYFKRTGIFPIMHVTAIRKELLDARPWLAQNLIDAFEASKAASYARLRNPRIVPLAWYTSYRDEEIAFFGGEDPWQYGLGEANRRNLETAIGYSHECGLIRKRLPVDDIFIEPAADSGRARAKRVQ